jgi:predicted aspartyl protease
MPYLDAQIGQDGPTIDVAIGVSIHRASALRANNQNPPQPVIARALIDTGASGTVIDRSLSALLGLVPTGTVSVHTPSTQGVPYTCNQYDISLSFVQPTPQSAHHSIAMTMAVIETDFAGQNIRALIGRDVLSRCLLFYHGHTGKLTISY